MDQGQRSTTPALRRTIAAVPIGGRKPSRPRLLLVLQVALSLGVALSLACDSPPPSSPTPGPEASDSPLARVDQSSITAEATDEALLLDLHDLDQARYALRRDRLLDLISQRLGPTVAPGSPEWNRRVELHLRPPAPPRLAIPDTAAPSRGLEEAPITIVEFIDFESAHSRRLQPELQRISDRYPERVRLIALDLPLPYHRYARASATAAHCAGEQGHYWSYHDVLLLEQPQLSEPDRAEYAARLGLDTRGFEICTRSGRHDARVAASLELAASIGVRRAATVFVNGLYLAGRPTFEEIDRVVRQELQRLGLDPTPAAHALDRRSPIPDRSDASRRANEAASEKRPTASLPKIPPEALAEPEVVITLSRAEVDRALEDRPALDRKLEASRAEFSGERLFKIRDVDETDFYARLGLEERDVLLVVNGAFLTVDGDSIWDAFESGDTVTLLVMRRGLPHTYAYRIR